MIKIDHLCHAEYDEIHLLYLHTYKTNLPFIRCAVHACYFHTINFTLLNFMLVVSTVRLMTTIRSITVDTKFIFNHSIATPCFEFLVCVDFSIYDWFLLVEKNLCDLVAIRNTCMRLHSWICNCILWHRCIFELGDQYQEHNLQICHHHTGKHKLMHIKVDTVYY